MGVRDADQAAAHPAPGSAAVPGASGAARLMTATDEVAVVGGKLAAISCEALDEKGYE